MRPAVALFLFLIPATVLADQASSPQTAEYCGDCHRAIYDGWKQSAHATAMESRLFQDALKMADSDFGNEARKVCLRCHSPAGVLVGDTALLRKVSWEGVTCDYCHSIREIATTGPNPVARVEFNEVKSGPSKDAVSPVHATVFSSVHTSSLACISCHEYRNSLGFPVLTTYSEWEESPYAKDGQECQSCHMYNVQGDVVDPRVKRTAGKGINLHRIPGSRSPEQLNKAIRMQWSAAREDDRVKVIVRLTNVGAGHYVPTGSPLRQLILEVREEPFGGGQPMSEERVFTRSITDQKGMLLQREHLSFLKGAKVVKDTRIAPRETRTETFFFPLAPGKKVRLEASLSYYYSPMASTEAQQKVKFLSMSQLFP